MKIHKIAKLIDKRGDTDKEPISNRCSYCDRWATHFDNEKIEKDKYIWKKEEELDDEERFHAKQNLSHFNVSHGICPFCMAILKKYDYEIDLKKVRELSLLNANNRYNNMKTAKIEERYVDMFGIRFNVVIEGEYRSATMNDPEEFPEANIHDAEIIDINEIEEYLMFFKDNYEEFIQREFNKYRGVFLSPPKKLSIRFYGISLLLINFSEDGKQFEIANAHIYDSIEFLASVPETIKEKIVERIDNGR